MSEISAVIIAGGRGTRSGNSMLPKSLVTIDFETLLFHQIEEIINSGISEIFVIGGYLGDLVEKEVRRISERYSSKIEYIQDVDLTGTRNALDFALEKVSNEVVLVVYGDIFFKFELGEFIKNHVTKNVDCSILVHPNNHPEDSDLVITEPFSEKVIGFKGKERPITVDFENLVCAGVFLLNLDTISDLNPSTKDLSQAVLNLSDCKLTKVVAFNTVGFVADTGTPERLKRVQEAFVNGIVVRRFEIGKMCLFLDLDGTLIENVENKKDVSLGKLDPKTCNLIARINQIGIPVFIVTNQPGISKGYFNHLDLQRFKANLDVQLANFSAFIDAWKVCPHHPEKGYKGEVAELKLDCNCRKPSSGLIQDLMVSYSLDLKRSYYLGDSWRDELMCEKLEIPYVDCSINRLSTLNTFLESMVNNFDYN
jgi:histidinol-phosphate phosphatase family protein